MEAMTVTKTIEKYKHLLSIAEQHKAEGVTHHDNTFIDDVIANYKKVISIYEDPKFLKQLNDLFKEVK